MNLPQTRCFMSTSTVIDMNSLLADAVKALKQNDFSKAIDKTERCLLQDRNNAMALYVNALASVNLGNLTEAIKKLRRCLAAERLHLPATVLLAELLTQVKHYKELAELLNPVISEFPNDVQLHILLSIAFLETDQAVKAEAMIRRAIELMPNNPGAYDLLGLILSHRRLNHQAIKAFHTGLALDPNVPTLHSNLALAYLQVGLTAQAIESLERALSLSPVEEHAAIIRALIFVKQHHLFDNANEEFLRLSKLAYDLDLKTVPKVNTRARSLPVGRKIRIGYLSGDFKQHPCGDFLANIFPNHSKDEFEIYCYDTRPKRDEVNAVIRAAVHSYNEINALSDEEVLNLLAKHDLDVLVDFSGITDFNRIHVFAAKPCPLQIMWVGYFGTLAMPEMDYLIGDQIAIKPEEEKYFVEKIYRLPYSYLPGEPYGAKSEPGSLPYLENGYITFGAFNKLPKITPDVMDTWSRILKRVPGSKLFFKNTCLNDPDTRKMILDFYSERGIDESRIILEGYSPHKEFVECYNRVDISLDSFPYGGGVTTIESLLMGVPVITWMGDRWMCRASSSYHKALGHEELIAETLDEYVDKAATLAADIDALNNYRQNLRREILGSEINAVNFVKHFENAVKVMLAS